MEENDDGGPKAAALFGQNLEALQEHARRQWADWRKTDHTPDEKPPPPASDKALSEACGVSRKAIAAIRKDHRPAQLDTVDAIARAYGLRAYQLLVEGLEPGNPATVAITQSEKDMLAAFLRTMQRFKGLHSGETVNGEGEAGRNHGLGTDPQGPESGQEVGKDFASRTRK